MQSARQRRHVKIKVARQTVLHATKILKLSKWLSFQRSSTSSKAYDFFEEEYVKDDYEEGKDEYEDLLNASSQPQSTNAELFVTQLSSSESIAE